MVMKLIKVFLLERLLSAIGYDTDTDTIKEQKEV